jgi:hypothetical protein
MGIKHQHQVGTDALRVVVSDLIVSVCPLATASRKPKSAASNATPVASCAARKPIRLSASVAPARSCSPARASTARRVLSSTAASVTV